MGLKEGVHRSWLAGRHIAASWLVLVPALSGLLSLGITGPVLAVDPSPSPTAPMLELQAWLDEPLPSDAAPATPLRVGALLWDSVRDTPMPASPTFVRLYPTSGDGAPVEAPASPDWPGHVVAMLTVPDGGVGRVEVLLRGTACSSDGCSVADALFDLRGAGPPDGAPLPSIVDADIEPLVPTFVAGEAMHVDIVLRPDVEWPDLELPDQLFIRVRVPRQDPFATESATLVDAAARRYEAMVTLPDPGRYILEATTTEVPAGGEVFGGSALTVDAVLPSTPDVPASPAPGAPATTADASGLVLAIVAAVAVVLSVGIIVIAIRPRP